MSYLTKKRRPENASIEALLISAGATKPRQVSVNMVYIICCWDGLKSVFDILKIRILLAFAATFLIDLHIQ